jgi:hypothetical protein
MMAALIWVHGLGLTEKAEMVIQILILIVTFSLVFVWLGANGPALLNDADSTEPYPYQVRALLPASLPDPDLREAAGPAADLEQAAAIEREVAPDSRDTWPVIVGSVLD